MCRPRSNFTFLPFFHHVAVDVTLSRARTGFASAIIGKFLRLFLLHFALLLCDERIFTRRTESHHVDNIFDNGFVVSDIGDLLIKHSYC